MSSNAEVPLEDALNLGMHYLQEGNVIIAEQTFRDIIAAVPDNFESHYYLGLSCYFSNDFQNAISAYETAIQLNADSAPCWSNMAVCHYKLGQTEKALAEWDKAIEIDPEFSDPHTNKANALWELKQHKEAEHHARRALEINEALTDAWLNLGNALAAQDRYEEAHEAWNKALEYEPGFANAYNNIGNAHRENGKLKEAEEACRKAIELDSEYAHALSNLANTLLDQGKFAEAEQYYKRAISVEPAFTQAHNNLAVCLIDQDRYEEAITSARFATSFDPNYAEAHSTLSMALRSLGKVKDAERAAQKALALEPQSAAAHIELADVLLMLDRYADAEVLLKKALTLDIDQERDSARLHLKLANVLDRAQRTDEAIEIVERIVAENPEMPEAHFSRAQIYHISNRLDEAEEAIQKTIELRPDYAAPYITLAEIYLSLGRLDDAETAIRKAQELNPKLPAIYLSLSHVKKYEDGDDDFNQLLALHNDGIQRGLAQNAALNFALFEAYEDIGDYEKAFGHLKAANDFKRRNIPYDQGAQENTYAQTKNIFTPQFIDQFKDKGYNSDIPVFILGMPRSGTTLTEQIISAHPDAYGAGELTDMGTLNRRFRELTPDNADKYGEAYVEAVKKYDKSGTAKRITDKMPGNYMHIGRIVSILPNAKIIHCRRDPVDNCLSCFKQNFSRGQYWSYNLDDLAHQYKQYNALMDYWREILGDRFIEVRYEETVSDFENQARRIIDYIGLEWNDACLEPHKQKRSVLTASKTQVLQPIYTSSVRAWQRYEEQLAPLMDALHYNKDTGQRG